VPACRYTVNPNPAGTWIGPDMARARQLVAASGTRGMRVEFWGARPWPQVGRYFRSLLHDLGYRSSLRTFDDLALIGENARGEPRPRPQLGLWGQELISTAPYSYLKLIVACGGYINLSRFCDPEIDTRMKRAAGAHGPEAIELWRRIESSLADQAPTVLLVTPNSISPTAARVGNYQSPPGRGTAARAALGQITHGTGPGPPGADTAAPTRTGTAIRSSAWIRGDPAARRFARRISRTRAVSC
jgi:ABC-type transport system substrate-binding protein